MSLQFPMLNDTLSFISLAREVALDRGDYERAQRLEKVIHQLQQVAVQTSHKPSNPPQELPSRSENTSFPTSPLQRIYEPGIPTINDRNRMVLTMTAGGMSEVEIAKQLGITLEEVRIVLKLSQTRRQTLDAIPNAPQVPQVATNEQFELIRKKALELYSGWLTNSQEDPK